MSYPGASSQTAKYGQAVERQAGRVLRALRSPHRLVVSYGREADPPDMEAAALAAVRVVGPDLFAPALLTGTPFAPADRQVIEDAFRAFPPTSGDAPEVAWRDRTTLDLLARHGGSVAGPAAAIAAPEADTSWQEWSAWMARVSSLALPGLDTCVQAQADRRVRALSRGTTRAMLRRDYPTAARLARWLALTASRGATPSLEVGVVLRHLEMCNSGARTALDLAIARALLTTREGRTA